MVQLIQGTVEYTTPRPFDSASARVALSFAFAEGDDPNLTISAVGQLAEAHAKAIIRPATREAPMVPIAPPINLGPVPTGTDGGAVLSTLALPGAPSSPTAAAAPVVVAPPAPSPASNVVQLPGQASAPMPIAALSPTSPAMTPAAPAPIAVGAPLPGVGAPAPDAAPSAASISDGDLVTAITHKNAALIPVYAEGSAAKIADLVATFVQPPAKAYAIPQAQRQAFLDQLNALA